MHAQLYKAVWVVELPRIFDFVAEHRAHDFSLFLAVPDLVNVVQICCSDLHTVADLVVVV